MESDVSQEQLSSSSKKKKKEQLPDDPATPPRYLPKKTEHVSAEKLAQGFHGIVTHSIPKVDTSQLSAPGK